MSEVHVHGVTSADEVTAIQGANASAVVADGLAAITTDATDGERAADVMRRHWQVLEDVAATATVLPVQFGTAMADERSVREEFLGPRADDIAAQLAALEGKVQITVKGTYDEAALLRSVIEGSPAAAQLRDSTRSLSKEAGHFQRIRLGEIVAKEVDGVRARDAELLHSRLDGLAVATSGESASGLQEAVNAAFLVERSRVTEFGQAIDALAEELSGRVELRLLGPLPPYNFADHGEPAWG